MNFTTKAETLHALEHLLRRAKVLPQICFSVEEIKNSPGTAFEKIRERGWEEKTLIVRSSAKNEDVRGNSNAGKYLSLGNIRGEKQIDNAVERVAAAMGADGKNQIFIQPYLENVEMSGVAFTAEVNTGGNYYVINYDDSTGSVTTVTDGSGMGLKTFYCFKGAEASVPSPLDRVICLCRELEELFGQECLDLEFALSRGELYLLQVRPLTLCEPLVPVERQKESLKKISGKMKSGIKPHPDLFGSFTIYGVMPDWNPAEMIGIRPKALALSLYKEIITNSVWAYQRDNYGYRNLRSFPLMVDFCGLPYIDTRVSFNSFLPKTLSDNLSGKLAEYYLRQLALHPEKHDKIEFEIAFTCYTFDLPERVECLKNYGFSGEEREELVQALRELTKNIICKDVELWKKDAAKIRILRKKHKEIMDSSLAEADKIYWLIEYCKRYGTLPFAGLARAGFIAVEFLRSMVNVGVISEKERTQYMNGLSTVGKNMAVDFAGLSKEAFLKKYGHLRPGTYDICSLRYDQNDEVYFDFSAEGKAQEEGEPFRLSLRQFEKIQKLLDEHALSVDVLSFFDFIKNAIEGREMAKFVFTHTLSDVLELAAKLGEELGFSREDMSYVSIQDIMEAYSAASDMKEVLLNSMEAGRRMEESSAGLVLPPLIIKPEDVYSFFWPEGEANYVTLKECRAEAVCLPSDKELAGKIVLLKSADPGYDWLFSRNIAGFITAYGGANSHMAIRSAEFGLPAVIGVGEKAFNGYSRAERLHIDCLNKKVTMIYEKNFYKPAGGSNRGH